jgi:hypothetical protein
MVQEQQRGVLERLSDPPAVGAELLDYPGVEVVRRTGRHCSFLWSALKRV